MTYQNAAAIAEQISMLLLGSAIGLSMAIGASVCYLAVETLLSRRHNNERGTR